MDWYPWFFQLFKADTMHLDPYQDGCYRRLIDHYMETRQPLPDNDYALARIVGDSHPNWVAMASAIVRPFFIAKDGLLYHKKCDEILEDQDKRAKKLSASGKAGAKKRWSKINGDDSHPISHPIATPMGSAIAQYNTIQENTGKEDNIPPPVEPSIPPLPPKNKKEGVKNGFQGKGGYRIENHLSDSAWQDARSHAPGWDIHYLCKIYDEGVNSGSREPPKYPNAAFPKWCKSYTKGKPPP
jgi:uncharacterized protein YdaU (DUF1376 family)